RGWVAVRADELAQKVGLFASEAVAAGANLPQTHLTEAHRAIGALREAVEQIERISNGGRPKPEEDRLFADFLRAAGRAKLREAIQLLQAKGAEVPSVDLIKQLLPISLVEGESFGRVHELW